MPNLDIRLLGKFSAQRAGQPVHGLDARKAQELFCYLLVHHERPHPRESLAALLWGDVPTAQSKNYLRKALWQLQGALDEGTAGGRPVVLAEDDWVQLNLHSVYFDVAALEQAYAQVEGTTGEQIAPDCAPALEAAVGAYHGDLLEGWYHDWCIYERERLQNMYLALLDKLMGYCEAQGHYEHGLAYGARILRCDRAREQTHRRLMRLLYLMGDRTAALRQYERCAAALREELDVAPTEYTAALSEQIKHNQPLEAATALLQLEHGAGAPLHNTLARLRNLQDSLHSVQFQIQQGIDAVEQVLRGERSS